MDTEASEGESDSETSSESQSSTCSDQSNSNLSNHSSYINEDGEFQLLSIFFMVLSFCIVFYLYLT